uniref:HNH nuclease domain-containing protein n=1 Tax=Cereibacter sphaeroides (strain ATCC 17025 / ATH 2.4.3) TaxID=349102 RepID=A4WY00_CERS5
MAASGGAGGSSGPPRRLAPASAGRSLPTRSPWCSNQWRTKAHPLSACHGRKSARPTGAVRSRDGRGSRPGTSARRRSPAAGCGSSRTRSAFDHVLPRARGGLTSWQNVVAACSSCNLRKRVLLPLR